MQKSGEWQINKSSNSCGSCHKVFEAGESIFSSIHEKPETFEVVRNDFCVACWAEQSPDHTRTNWKTVKQADHVKKVVIVDNDVLLNLFERLKDSESQRNRAYAYLLALILMRKRVLVFEDIRFVDGEELMVMSFRIKREDDENEVSVADPGLNEEQIAALNEDLNKLIQIGEFSEESIA